MKDKTGFRFFPLLAIVSALITLGLFFISCGSDDDAPVAPANRVITADVSATTGGTFSDNPTQPTITITIPAGGMITDAQLVVDRVQSPPAVGANQTAASEAFAISLTTSTGGPPRMFADIIIEIPANPAPVHPQIGEIAELNGAGTEWERLDANFFRPSDSTMVTTTRMTAGTFRVVHRSLQLAGNGDAIAAGLNVFLNETFGNENFFGDVLGLHTLLNGRSPNALVPLGVQIDSTKLPAGFAAVLEGTDNAAKDAALADPVTTQQLIKAGAVVGVKGFYATTDPADIVMTRAGITCALCHLNVTLTMYQLSAGPATLPIGPPEIDGAPNTQMDAGAILALTPFGQDPLNAAIAADLNSWGPGAFDVRALPDNPLDDGVNNPTSNPPLWNFIDLQEQGYLLGWDGLFKDDGTNNNALASQAEAVYDLVMHANGAFGTASGNLPPELRITPPQALLNSLGNAETAEAGNVIITQSLLDLQTWMRSLASPAPGTFDEATAEQGFLLFYGKAGCVVCHRNPDIFSPDLFPDITDPLPTGELAGGIKVPSLRGVSHTAPYFHNHSAANLEQVVARFVANGRAPILSASEQAAIVEYLRSL